MLEKLNSLAETPFEQWPENGVILKAVSANGDGIVRSGILENGTYFYKKWDYCDGVHSNPRFVLG